MFQRPLFPHPIGQRAFRRPTPHHPAARRPVLSRSLPVMICLLAGTAWARPTALEPYDASGKLTVSLPRAWKVTADLDKGMIVAQQDPSRSDAAAVILVIQPDPTATEDQLLDVVAGSVSKDLKVRKREALPGGRGHTMIADGTADGIKIRLGAVAIVANGASLVCLLASRPDDFDRLGGIDLVTSIIASLKTAPAAQPPPPPAEQAPPAPAATAAPAIANGRLVVPPLDHKVALAELAGEWRQDDSVTTRYVSASTGAYAGFDSIATTEHWTLDGKGGVFSSFLATVAGNGGARQIKEKKGGTVTLAPSNVITLHWKGAAEQHYLLRGWVELPTMTVMTLNGPWYQGGVPADVLADPHKGFNLDQHWVRARPAR